ncbi:two-component system, NtrC family, sensor kinase [Modicisalibacter ilicicola DSM 19980]|uniref:histidine kinase n=1 Tax=Modicisalibacter ilicicola DSM 19980 TaxID=1121942 RepID=A0A1M4Z685_9GAMM|nr:HAMP domain-containing sensor histidine kinase [Halomonas ilicicola]SHF13569.1 two-component system, NtrC family, sensor kinase [Halomonas ilicicola DSM 19980]
MKRLRRWLDVSIRRRLLWMACVPLLLFSAALIGLTAYWTSAYSDRQLYMKVRADLAVATRILDGLGNQQQARLAELAGSQALTTALQGDGARALDALLEETRIANQLDWLRSLGPDELPGHLGETLAAELRRGHPVQGLDALSPERLDAIDPLLPDRARLALRSTPRATPTERQVERNGLALRVLYPLHDPQGRLRLVLDAGRLLSRDPAPVDDIRDLIYGPGTLPESSEGTVTLFLGDVRVSTNVRLPNGERALGTRVSKQVARQVLERGEPFIDRAFVVSDWYIAAYDVLQDIHGQRIGMIYAGYPEAPFTRLYRDTLLQIAVTLALVMLFSLGLVLRGVERLAAPIRRMHRVIHGIREGDHLRIGELGSDDELAELAQEFDAMLDRLDAHRNELRRAAEQLERRVDDRTRALREKTRALEEHIDLLKQARTRLMTQEKLAALGELTAGIAHEINNPAAVILGHIELIEQQLGPDAAPVKEEIEMIIAQVERIRALIDNLLQYSRPGHPHPPRQLEDINDIVSRTETLVRHALDKRGQRLTIHLHARRRVECHSAQLQQVLINLIINAAQCGEAEQHIVITTRDIDRNHEPGVGIDIADQGPGIPEHLRERIFDPFFTTREAGSGLGLAICAGILRRNGGDISVTSTPGQGSVFHVWLPCRARPGDADEDTTRKLLEGLSDVAQSGSARAS